MRAVDVLPPAKGRVACLCCPPQTETLHPDDQPHPGFGCLRLTRDGQIADGWYEFCDFPAHPPKVVRWSVGSRKGKPRCSVSAGLEEAVTVREIDEACAADPDHDWRLEVHRPLRGAVYQRQGRLLWVLVETNEGFA